MNFLMIETNSALLWRFEPNFLVNRDPNQNFFYSEG